MIKIQEKENSNELNILVHGEILDKVHIVMKKLSPTHSNKKLYAIFSTDVYESKKLATISESDLLYNEPLLTFIKLENWFTWIDFYNYISLKRQPDDDEGTSFYDSYNLVFAFVPDLQDWNHPYSFADYCREFLFLSEDFDKLISEGELEFRQGREFGLFLTFEAFDYFQKEDSPKSIAESIERYEKYFRACHLKTVENLESKNHKQSILTSFIFPEEIKTICEQYLLYFAQFLRDLGINATPNLKEEAGKVLFSVTPTDDIEALDKIREALEVYLRLPSSPIVSNSQEIAIQRLESQVEYFRSQIRLARAELQLKEATIQQQQVTIMKLGENVLVDSMVKPVSENKTTEKVVKGVEVGKIEELEKYGVSIDLGELFRTMKDWFKKK